MKIDLATFADFKVSINITAWAGEIKKIENGRELDLDEYSIKHKEIKWRKLNSNINSKIKLNECQT